MNIYALQFIDRKNLVYNSITNSSRVNIYTHTNNNTVPVSTCTALGVISNKAALGTEIF